MFNMYKNTIQYILIACINAFIFVKSTLDKTLHYTEASYFKWIHIHWYAYTGITYMMNCIQMAVHLTMRETDRETERDIYPACW